MQTVGSLTSHAFDRRHLAAVDLNRQDCARLRGPAVDVNRTSPALACVATDVGSGEVAFLPKMVHQQGPRIHLATHRFRIEGVGDRNAMSISG
jgi:hypothetical protein